MINDIPYLNGVKAKAKGSTGVVPFFNFAFGWLMLLLVLVLFVTRWKKNSRALGQRRGFQSLVCVAPCYRTRQ